MTGTAASALPALTSPIITIPAKQTAARAVLWTAVTKRRYQLAVTGGGTLAWKRFESSEDFVNLASAVGSTNNSAAYAYCELENGEEGDAVFQLLAHDQAKIWLNGSLVALNRVSEAFAWLSTATVPIRKGKNPCLLKVSHSLGDC